MTSRFFATGSSSESDSEPSDEEVITQAKPVAPTRFFMSDDEEDTKRVVRSAKSKRHEEIMDVIKNMSNQRKIKDISRVLSSFEDLTRVYTKGKKSLDVNDRPPRFYIRAIVELEDFVSECWGDKKSLNKVNAKSLSTLRQKIRKYNKEFEDQVTEYRENPDAEGGDMLDDGEEQQESDDDDGGWETVAPKKKPKTPPAEAPKSKILKGSDDESGDSDSDYWPTTSDESSSSDDEPESGFLTAAYFLKK